MAYKMASLEMTTAFNDLLPYRHPFVQVHFKFSEQFGGANTINVMFKVEKGDVFTKEAIKKIYDMTQAMDRVWGVNHDQISSIGHRTTRYLTVLGGTIAAPPVMRRAPKTDEEVEDIKKICYNTESIYGQLVSLNGQALLLKANFIEGRLDYQRIFDEINRTVVEPFNSSEHTIWIAGEPRLYGWIYHYANEVYTVFIVSTVLRLASALLVFPGLARRFATDHYWCDLIVLGPGHAIVDGLCHGPPGAGDSLLRHRASRQPLGADA